MSVRFLIIYPDFLEQTKHVKNIPGNYNEGIASISAVLKQGGHDVVLYHLTYMPDKQEFVETVKAFAPGIIGWTIRTTAMDMVSEMSGWLDDELSEIPVIAGGYHPTLAPEESIMTRGIDAVCVGEGEYPTLDLLNSFEIDGKLHEDTQSYWFKHDDGSIVKNPVRPYLLNLDELPFPDVEIFDFKNLRSNRIDTAEVLVSRGCVYSCTYCANAQLRNAYEDRKNYARFRTPENAIELLEYIIEKDPSIKFLNFNDAILNMYEDWFYEFMDLYKVRIARKYTCNLRFNNMDEKMCYVLAEGGCYLVTIGLENGNEDYRVKYLHRSMKNDHMVEISHWLKDAGVTVYTYNIVGLPHETLPLSLETIKLNARMHTDNVVIGIFYPYPSTELRQIAEDAGFLDPTIERNDLVQLKMPNYSRDDILYARYSFIKLIKKYQKIYAIPDKALSTKKEAHLDKVVLGAHHPRALIWRIVRLKHKTVVTIKRVASIVMPSLYRKLRLRKYNLEEN
jgi:radical SAM superfamily enzyme YgiQ (UPF0313 family)